MPDINLLPDENRREEKKEQQKKTADSDPVFHLPEINFTPPKSISDIKKPAPLTYINPVPQAAAPRANRPGFFSRLFGKKKPRPAVSNLTVKSSQSVKTEVAFSAPPPVLKAAEPLNQAKSSPVLPPFSSGSIDVNLLPEGSSLIPLAKLMNYFYLAALGGVVIVGLIYLGFIFYNNNYNNQLTVVDNQITALKTSIIKLQVKETEARQWNERVAAVNQLLEKHVYWSKFFPYLEKYTLADIYFVSIEASQDGTVTLSAVASNYTGIARQYATFLNHREVFPTATVSGFKGDEAGVGFEVALTLAPELYYSLEQKKP